MTTTIETSDTDEDVEQSGIEFPTGDDLASSRATDFYSLDELLSESERAIRDRVREWVDTEVSPIAADYWEAARFPVELVQGYGALGIAGGSLVGDGCPGLSFLAEGMIAAELARGDGSVATLNAVHSGLAMTTIGMLGSAEQRARFLPRMAACNVLGAFALTEPRHGSDVVALETRAHRDGDEWVLDGEKRWIGNGTVAGIVVVWARDDDGNVGAFVVEHPDGADHPVPGYHARKIVGKAANRGVWQAQIKLQGVRVPAGARLVKANSWDDTNLVLKAAKIFAEATGWKGGATFFLEKRIPVGAGLGGGSSDAVATLQALNRIVDSPRRLGADGAAPSHRSTGCPLHRPPRTSPCNRVPGRPSSSSASRASRRRIGRSPARSLRPP